MGIVIKTTTIAITKPIITNKNETNNAGNKKAIARITTNKAANTHKVTSKYFTNLFSNIFIKSSLKFNF